MRRELIALVTELHGKESGIFFIAEQMIEHYLVAFPDRKIIDI